jgi:transcriptional antiterminator RfaH
VAFWAATRLETRREKVAQFFLEQAGFEVYVTKIRYRRCRRIELLSPLLPGYLFTRIELQWRGVRLCPGVIKLVMNGDEPSRMPDEVIAEIRSRERNGAIELPRHRLKAGDRVQIVSGRNDDRRGRVRIEAPMPASDCEAEIL